jgi:hypothetical protein
VIALESGEFIIMQNPVVIVLMQADAGFNG